jgi:hypothetical protein
LLLAMAAAASALSLLAACATPGVVHSLPAVPPGTNDQFCIAAQAHVTGSRVATVNRVYTDYQAFLESKPAPRPLTTRQYAWFEDDARSAPRMISCKMKTADHIRAEYGADQVGDDTSCAAVNALTLHAVLSSMTRAERGQLKFDGGRRVTFDPDLVTHSGQFWVEPFAVLALAPDGALHVKSKGLKNDWLDPRFAQQEPRFRGTRYCHLVAPEYLKRALLGDVTP